jgi:hypothetical protein
MAAPLLISVVGSIITAVGIVAFPIHGDAEETVGVGPMICGLSPDPPASVAAVGIVASLNADPVIVARPGIGATAVLLKNSAVF